jgi:hypothetical protein
MAHPDNPSPPDEADDRTMPDDELVAILTQHATRAVGHYDSEISGDQAESIDFYYRRPLGNEREGRSKVVDGTVAIVVDNAVAALLKPFTSADDTVSFEPKSEEDEEAAKQATEYVNYVLHNDNPGFIILHNWFKDACLSKLGVVKCYWEDKSERKPQLVEGLDASQIEAIQKDIVDGPYADESGFYSAYVLEDYADGCIRIENVPPEEYLISPYAKPGETPPYEAHRTRKARSDLIDLGFDAEVVESLSPYGEVNADERTVARFRDEQWDSARADAPGDKSRDLIEVYDEYALLDYDGDGISELRRIVRSGNTVLMNEEVESGPFATLCPVPMPHKVYGLSLADQSRDKQLIRTVLWRQTLDNLYLSNNPRPVVPEGAERSDGSTVESLENNAPGAIVFEGRAEIRFEAVPFVADKSYPMLEFVDQETEAQTGISKAGQGLDRNSLAKAGQVTATQAAQEEDGRNVRVEMIARIFAETGVKDLFRKMLRLMVQHQPRERVIRLRNQWVPIDPRGWNAEMDLSVSVGLGVGNQAKLIAQAEAVLSTMERLAQSPFGHLVKPQNVYNAIKRMYTAAGIKNIDDFIEEPQEGQEPPEKPDPEMAKAQADAMLQAEKLKGEQQASQAKIQMMQAEAAAKLQLEREKAEAEAELARQKAEFEASMAIQRLEQEQQLAERQMQIEESMAERRQQLAERSELHKNRPGGDLDK